MKTRKPTVAAPVFHAPLRMDWNDEKLGRLDQDQLLVLLANLDHQRAIGRLDDVTATPLEARITALLSGRHLSARRKQVAAAAQAASDANSGATA